MEFIYPIVSGMEVGILVYSRAYIIEWANDSGETTHVYEIIQEITAYKDFQKVLTESERRYREMIDLLPQVFFESNLQGRILESNRFAREKFAYTQRDIAHPE